MKNNKCTSMKHFGGVCQCADMHNYVTELCRYFEAAVLFLWLQSINKLIFHTDYLLVFTVQPTKCHKTIILIIK